MPGKEEIPISIGPDVVVWQHDAGHVSLHLTGEWLEDLGEGRLIVLQPLLEAFGEKLREAVSMVNQGEADIRVCLRAIAHGDRSPFLKSAAE
jgi:hypothetical protein